MKNTAFPLISVLLVAVSGCSGSFAKVKGALNEAPEWYADRRVEIRGEGYPELIDVPVIKDAERPGQTLPASAERVTAIGKLFAENARAELPDVSADAAMALRSDIQQQFAELDLSAGFLTPAEIQSIRDSFNVPRVTQNPRKQR